MAWQIETSLNALASDHPALAGAAAAAVAAGISLAAARLAGVSGGGGSITVDTGDLPTTYDISAIKAYWGARPFASFKRTSGLVAKIVTWGISLLADIATGPDTVEANSFKRAAALRDIISEQGPAFVKVGQAVAIRPDLLPPAYLQELQKLLDQVAPFESIEARELIQAQLGGQRLEDVFEDVRAFDAPVAAASIGQVYKAKLKASGPGKTPEELETWGGDVAVKVQRPGILGVVTLDLLVIRSLLEAAAAIPANGNAQLEGIVQGAKGFIPVLDVAAERFLEELDYNLEADNAARFEKDMASVEVVRGAIKVPHVYRGLSGRCVLTQEWVEGRKLTDITADPTTGPLRAKLVQTLLNSYMVQFLETGFLHADPHPGNFMLMPDGRLCILDYGMMTTIGPDQRIAFIEYIAHLSARDYDKTLQDLVNLGFVPPELANDPASRAVVVPVLAETLETLYGSGGGITTKADALTAQSASRVGELSDKLEALAKDYPLILPPYFVLILRAFGTLEGLGLSVDANYAIIDECFPYVARRMLADDSPRMRAALQSFVYGGGDRLKVSRVRSIAAGFSDFTNNMGETETVAAEAAAALAARADGAGPAATSAAATESVNTPPGSSRNVPGALGTSGQTDAATRDALALVFSAEGNYLQEILVDEAVRAADALARGAASGAWRALGAGAPAAAALGLLVRPGPFGVPLALIPGLNIPILLSLVASQNGGAITLTLDDKRNLALLRSIAELVSPEFARRLGSASAAANRVNRSSGGGGVGSGSGVGVGATMSAEEMRRIVGLVQVLAPRTSDLDINTPHTMADILNPEA
jgi:predicted unusual protein kinase regulating ubiquinone biosynthesis (AarF/ABC1/UbiB family)